MKTLKMAIAISIAIIWVGDLHAENKLGTTFGFSVYGGDYWWDAYTWSAGYTAIFFNNRVLVSSNIGLNVRATASRGWSDGIGPYISGGIKFIVINTKYLKSYLGSSVSFMKSKVYDTSDPLNYMDIKSLLVDLDLGVRIHFIDAFGLDLGVGTHFVSETNSGELYGEPFYDETLGFVGYHFKVNLFHIF